MLEGKTVSYISLFSFIIYQRACMVLRMLFKMFIKDGIEAALLSSHQWIAFILY